MLQMACTVWLFDTVSGYNSNDCILLNDFFQVIFSDIRNAHKVRIRTVFKITKIAKSLYIFKMTSVLNVVLLLMLVVLQNVSPRGIFLIFYWQDQLHLKIKFRVFVVWYNLSANTTSVPWLIAVYCTVVTVFVLKFCRDKVHSMAKQNLCSE